MSNKYIKFLLPKFVAAHKQRQGRELRSLPKPLSAKYVKMGLFSGLKADLNLTKINFIREEKNMYIILEIKNNTVDYYTKYHEIATVRHYILTRLVDTANRYNIIDDNTAKNYRLRIYQEEFDDSQTYSKYLSELIRLEGIKTIDHNLIRIKDYTFQVIKIG